MKPIILAAGLLALATPALADPCKAIPLKGPLPAYLHRSAVFSGPVVYVGDGDGLCVDVGSNVQKLQTAPGSTWVEVRVEGFYAPELHDAGGQGAKIALETITRNKRLRCVSSGRKSYDRVVATCSINGRDLGDLMRTRGVAEGGRGFSRGSQ